MQVDSVDLVEQSGQAREMATTISDTTPIDLSLVQLCRFAEVNPGTMHRISSSPALADVLEEDVHSTSASNTDTDPTALKLDRNYEYTIWLSYAEVYNEKAYDLFGALEPDCVPSTPRAASGIPRST